MSSPIDVLHFLSARAATGERGALVVLAGIAGTASRSLGTLLGVSEGGEWRGSLSGGCVEAAVVGEVQRAIRAGRAEVLRLGAGSPLIDIRLPCGGGLDLLIVPDPDPAAIAQTLAMLEARQPVRLAITRDGALNAAPATPDDTTGWHGDTFALRIDPQLHLLVAGHGEEAVALAALAQTWGARVTLLSPEPAILAAAASDAAPVLLHTLGPSPALALDPWSAFVTLFHDHDWEVPLLVQALEQDALLIGAMGSRRTHAARLAALADAGASPESRDRIVGPIGLIQAARDPRTLALSVLAEVVAAYAAKTALPVREEFAHA